MKPRLFIISISCLLLAPASLLAKPTRADHQAEESIKASYTYRTILDNNVKVEVDQGVATLTGKVRDDEQSRLAEDTAAAFDGVTRVVNELKIQAIAKPGSDEWVALKIRSRLLAKANVSLTNTHVEVRNGVAYLTGTADSQAQKDLTEEYVKDIEGVRSVSNELRLGAAAKDATTAKADSVHDNVVHENQRGAADDTHHSVVAEKMDDGSVTAQIKYELFSHRSTSALKTKVDTRGGRVVISGDASSEAEKDLVTKLAKSVRGVESVTNNMVVQK